MLRRVLIFLAILAGGFALLALFTEGPWTPSALPDLEEDLGVIASPIRLDKDSSGQSGIDGIVLGIPGGRILLDGPMHSYSRKVGNDLDLPSYRLDAKESKALGHGLYDLTDITVVFPRPVANQTGRMVYGEPIVVNARSMTVALESDGDVQRIDETQEMAFRDVEVRAKLSELETGGGAQGVDYFTLNSKKLWVRIVDDRIMLYTKDSNEAVTLRLDSEQGPLRLFGRGLDANLSTRTSSKSDGTARALEHEPSRLELFHDIRILGPEPLARSFEVTGDGPLKLVAVSAGTWKLHLLNNIRLRGNLALGKKGSGTTGKADDIKGRGHSLTAWFRSSPGAGSRGESSKEAGLSDVLLTGREERASIDLGAQRILADEIDLAIGPFGRPGRIHARGHAELIMLDADGFELGRMQTQGGIRWSRPGLWAETFLAGIGMSFHMGALPLIAPVWPEEMIHVDGPARFESRNIMRSPSRDRGPAGFLREGTASQGLLLLLAVRYGVREPFLALGLGEVSLEGMLDPQTEFLAHGSEGFVLHSAPGVGFYKCTLGPMQADKDNEFSFEATRRSGKDAQQVLQKDRIQGRGWLSIESIGRDRVAHERGPGKARSDAPVEIRFHAALQHTLEWQRSEGGKVSQLRGIKSAWLRKDEQHGERLELLGQPLMLSGGPEGLSATAEICRKEGDGPWRFIGDFETVYMHVPARGSKRAESWIRAREIETWQLGRAAGGKKEADFRIVARDGVRLEMKLEGDARRKIILTCDRLEYLPWLVPPIVERMIGGVLGQEGSLILPSFLGSKTGIIEARGSVVLTLEEAASGKRAGQRGSECARRILRGESLDLQSDGLASLLLPKIGEKIEVELLGAKGTRIILAASRCMSRGQGLFLGGGSAERAVVKIYGAKGEGKQRILFVHCDTPIRYIGDGRSDSFAQNACPMDTHGKAVADTDLPAHLLFPGHVFVQEMDSERVPIADGFRLRCNEELRFLFGYAQMSNKSSIQLSRTGRWRLPSGLSHIFATGDVRMQFHELSARAQMLSYCAQTGWLKLEEPSGGDVRVSYMQEIEHVSRSRLELNLLTKALRGGEFRLLVKAKDVAGLRALMPFLPIGTMGMQEEIEDPDAGFPLPKEASAEREKGEKHSRPKARQ